MSRGKPPSQFRHSVAPGQIALTSRRSSKTHLVPFDKGTAAMYLRQTEQLWLMPNLSRQEGKALSPSLSLSLSLPCTVCTLIPTLFILVSLYNIVHYTVDCFNVMSHTHTHTRHTTIAVFCQFQYKIHTLSLSHMLHMQSCSTSLQWRAACYIKCCDSVLFAPSTYGLMSYMAWLGSESGCLGGATLCSN